MTQEARPLLFELRQAIQETHATVNRTKEGDRVPHPVEECEEPNGRDMSISDGFAVIPSAKRGVSCPNGIYFSYALHINEICKEKIIWH